MDKSVVTIDRFITEQERRHPEATGAFSNILYDMALAAKLISRAVNRAGLIDVLGMAGRENVHGEQVQKLDEYAHEVIVGALSHGGHACVLGSEEAEAPIPIPEGAPIGPYAVLFDPLDGSSNIDANVSIGTIFSVHRRVTGGKGPGGLEDLLQPGSRQCAAGYVLYGSSTMLVFTTGGGVHGFTLDPSIGEFLLSHPDIRIPSPGKKIYSVNEGNFTHWSEGQRRLVRRFRGQEERAEKFSARYVGSLVADLHRTLLYGGIFMYPASRKAPAGKLRLLYEIAPMALICERAGGRATDGVRDILDIQPESLHQRTPVYIGSAGQVDLAAEYLATEG
ncbi:MAG: class 1 fructose-bisphosphatase [Gemmatimonadota bacterium]